jgi:hypothetical protein
VGRDNARRRVYFAGFKYPSLQIVTFFKMGSSRGLSDLAMAV